MSAGSEVGHSQGFALGFQKGVRLASDIGAKLGYWEGFAHTSKVLLAKQPPSAKVAKLQKQADRLDALAREVRLEPHNDQLATKVATLQKLGQQLEMGLGSAASASDVDKLSQKAADFSF